MEQYNIEVQKSALSDVFVSSVFEREHGANTVLDIVKVVTLRGTVCQVNQSG